jgi:hypothetical protein
VKVTGFPVSETHIVSGSLPICSVVNPWVLVTLPGTVTGRRTGQVLPVAVSVTAVIVVPLVVKLSLGAHASRAMRLANEVAMSSCLREIIGHFTLRLLARLECRKSCKNLQSGHLLGNNLNPDLEHG